MERKCEGVIVGQLNELIRVKCQGDMTAYHGRPHIGLGQMGSAEPPGKMDEKLKSENMQKKSSFYRAMPCIRGTSHGSVSVRVHLCPSVCYKSEFY